MIQWEEELRATVHRLLKESPASNLSESITYSILSEGKRFRPRLMEASAALLNVPAAAFVPFAVALEMIHTFTLIHDDLPCMDNDPIRRGQPTNHMVFGDALAMLAGDSLVFLAFEASLQARSHCPSEAWARALSRLIELGGPRGVIGGQALEMLLTNDTHLETLRTMHSLKTGALFDAAILIPAELAQLSSSPERMSTIQNFSHAFGLAFQTADDLEDAEKERDPDTGMYPATSILHYLTPAEALDTANLVLNAATERLQKIWPDTHSNLSAMTAQLQTKLKDSFLEMPN
ncbi:MAG: polyprenyl synthetase family protein [Bdellovibrionales bacterium]|nr:polyprenyl synthetase family protein [Bdellovibrionales bacterium]